jgi:2-hydroxy-3-oxopropionate reductase
MTKLAFIGLGIMGSPMAANLVTAGFDVLGYNRSPEKVAVLVAQGGRGADKVADAVRDADVVATMLPDSPDVENVALGDDGVLTDAKHAALLIDFSTIRPDTARTLAEAGVERGIRVLDAPVSGGEQGAIEALCQSWWGLADDFAAAKPVLDAVGKTVVHVGPAGSGQTVKAANQLIVAGTIELVAEAIVFLEAHGIDTHAALQILAGNLVGNRILERNAAGMLKRAFKPGFRVDLHHKDMGIVIAAAREAGVVIPLGAVAAELMAALRAQGGGALDHSALLRGIERLSGRGGDDARATEARTSLSEPWTWRTCCSTAAACVAARSTTASRPLVGEVRTAPRYRFYFVRDELPARYPDPDQGAAIAGELYDVPTWSSSRRRRDYVACLAGVTTRWGEQPGPGELVRAALDAGATRVAIGLGGSAASTAAPGSCAGPRRPAARRLGAGLAPAGRRRTSRPPTRWRPSPPPGRPRPGDRRDLPALPGAEPRGGPRRGDAVPVLAADSQERRP